MSTMSRRVRVDVYEWHFHGGIRTRVDVTMRRGRGHAVCRSSMQDNNFTSPSWKAPLPWTFWFHGTREMK
jgi:hypothetical protein